MLLISHTLLLHHVFTLDHQHHTLKITSLLTIIYSPVWYHFFIYVHFINCFMHTIYTHTQYQAALARTYYPEIWYDISSE